jgi:hypothetical protein
MNSVRWATRARLRAISRLVWIALLMAKISAIAERLGLGHSVDAVSFKLD